MIEVGGLFPGAISRPIIANEALIGIITTSNLTPDQKKWWNKLKPGQSGSDVHPSGHWFNFLKLSPTQICPTIPKASGNAKFSYWDSPIGLSIDGYKRLGSFPDVYKMCGGYGKEKNRIGNSVPPLLMKAIATQIRHKLWSGKPLTQYPKSMIYPEILEAAWQDHLAPRDENAPTVISTFAGGGGSSLGYSMAGYQELLAVEWDNNAVATFKLNFPDVPVYHGDIAELSVEECMKLAGLSEPGELDLLDGSPPCQGVSTAGKRNLNDPRNQLFCEFVRLLRGLQPKVFVMENVSGLVKGKMKLIFAEIMRELKGSGYQVKCKKLNAMYFYVPQSRERLIFIGIRND